MIIPCVTLIHLGWAFLIFFWSDLIGATPLALLTAAVQSWTAIEAILISSVVLATAAPLFKRSVTRVICFLPQQSVVTMSFSSSLIAVLSQQYADGVPRHFSFILADQLPILLGAVLHTYSLVRLARADESEESVNGGQARSL